MFSPLENWERQHGHFGGTRAARLFGMASHWASTAPEWRIELKFNPYHDPRNGRFTFALGGPRSLSDVVISDRKRLVSVSMSPRGNIGGTNEPRLGGGALSGTSGGEADGIAASAALFQPPMAPEPTRTGRGSNIRAFYDPMTLEQAFPGLSSSPGGAIVALADNIFDFTGPSRAANAELMRNLSRRLIEQTKQIDPHYHFDSLGEPQTLHGQLNQLSRLRFDRAAAFLRVNHELRPLQIETLRFVQESTDRAYDLGQRLLRAGRLKIRLSESEALGNFIDREVRRDLRQEYRSHGIVAETVRVNRRENDSSGTELTYRRPDARVGNVAFGVTLTEKTLRTPQIRGFFATDFRPERVVIIRPSQLGGNYTYAISRPETR